MPVSIVVGAQYGSEGKGKVALHWALRGKAAAAVRVGGPNSGHTVVWNGETFVFRQLPTASLIQGMISILPPGAYIDVEVLLREISTIGGSSAQIVIDPRAAVVTDLDKAEERSSDLGSRIGSTMSGTGATVARRVVRDGTLMHASDVPELQQYLGDTLPLLREISDSQRLVIEGTQGYGLSVLHGLEGEFATSRDTTAAGFLSETGLSPFDVDEIVLVARSHPIRVAGNSGNLANETTWEKIGAKSGQPKLVERTTVTNRVRRVGDFEPEIVKRAIYANDPTHIVLNHVDYVTALHSEGASSTIEKFLSGVESSLNRAIDLIGLDAENLVERSELRATLANFSHSHTPSLRL